MYYANIKGDIAHHLEECMTRDTITLKSLEFFWNVFDWKYNENSNIMKFYYNLK